MSPKPHDTASESAATGLRADSAALPHHDELEAAFGQQSLDHVAVHTGPRATEAADALGASAFTTGNHVAFADASQDRETVSHEVAHVLNAGTDSPSGAGTPPQHGEPPGYSMTEPDPHGQGQAGPAPTAAAVGHRKARGAGARGAAQGTGDWSSKEPADTAEPCPTSWIEIELVDRAHTPVPYEFYEVIALDGKATRSGALDHNGFAHIDLPHAGTCAIGFPNLPAQSWRRATPGDVPAAPAPQAAAAPGVGETGAGGTPEAAAMAQMAPDGPRLSTGADAPAEPDATAWPRAGRGTRDEPGILHRCDAGDSISSLAERYGLKDWRQIWHHPSNGSVVAQTGGDPRRIPQGTILFIPTPTTKQLQGTTEQRHRFIVNQ